MLEDLTFFEDGKYTARDNRVRETAEGLKRPNRTPWGAASEYVYQMRHDKNWLYHSIPIISPCLKEIHKLRVFRKRTASEIIESGYVSGCTDTALVFAVLARELGVPTRYVETFEEKWLQDRKCRIIRQGHTFVDILVDGEWKAYDPRKGFTANNDYIINGKKFVEVGKGLDFSEVYIKEENGSHEKEPTDLQSLHKIAKVFRQRYKK